MSNLTKPHQSAHIELSEVLNAAVDALFASTIRHVSVSRLPDPSSLQTTLRQELSVNAVLLNHSPQSISLVLKSPDGHQGGLILKVEQNKQPTKLWAALGVAALLIVPNLSLIPWQRGAILNDQPLPTMGEAIPPAQFESALLWQWTPSNENLDTQSMASLDSVIVDTNVRATNTTPASTAKHNNPSRAPTYWIRIFSSNREESIIRVTSTLKQNYRTVAFNRKNTPWWGIELGPFKSNQDAKSALNRLDNQFKANKPWIIQQLP